MADAPGLQARPSWAHTPARRPAVTLLDAGALPVEELAVLCQREGQRPRPIYQTHRWFARRFGAAFRALLTAALTASDGDFWRAYYEGVDWRQRTVLDVFVGGGTAVIEALRLGADVIGVDVDAVACAITRFEMSLLTSEGQPDLRHALARVSEAVFPQIAPYYRTHDAAGAPRDALHYFWVQVVACAGCGRRVEAHPHYQLAYEAEGDQQWVFCAQCHAIQQVNRSTAALACAACGAATTIEAGTVTYGTLTCPCCGRRDRLHDLAARTGEPPQWRLFALETVAPQSGQRRVIPMKERAFQVAQAEDLACVAAATAALDARRRPDGTLPGIPRRRITVENRVDNRLLAYGYAHYHELFHPRQLLHLSLLAEVIDAEPEPAHEALALAFSDHLLTNCLLTAYANGWRRLTPLFTIRAYRHVPRPVELNPWLDGTGRGTFPNAVHQVARAAAFAQSPKEPVVSGGFRPVTPLTRRGGAVANARIIHGDAQRLVQIATQSVDLVLTDPPYFDNIAYGELSEFFLPWLQQFGLAPAEETAAAPATSLAAKTRDASARAIFQTGLTRSFREIARVLKPEGRLVFTYQHKTPEAWSALAHALARADLRPIQLFPLLGDSGAGLHRHEGASQWDAVFVCVGSSGPPPSDSHGEAPPLRLGVAALAHAQRHAAYWRQRLTNAASCGYRDADQRSFIRACFVAAALGMFAPTHRRDAPVKRASSRLLDDVLRDAMATPTSVEGG